jgi:hypothetical protein
MWECIEGDEKNIPGSNDQENQISICGLNLNCKYKFKNFPWKWYFILGKLEHTGSTEVQKGHRTASRSLGFATNLLWNCKKP